jgi:hypothetical protein
MRNWVAAARMAMPSTVFFMAQANTTRRRIEATMVMRLRAGTMTPANSTVCEKKSGSGTLRGRGEMNRRAAFCRMVEKANEVMRTAVTDFERTGRNAT